MTASVQSQAEHLVLFKEAGRYAAFPSLHWTRDGALAVEVTARGERSHHDIRGGKDVRLISRDMGRTWGHADEPTPNRDCWTRDGRVVWSGVEGWQSTGIENEAAIVAAGKRHSKPHPGLVHYLNPIALAHESTDGGRTWQTHNITVPERSIYVMNYLYDATLLTTAGGVRVNAIYGVRYQGDLLNQMPCEPLLVRSEDDGRSWRCNWMFAGGAPEPFTSLNETAIVEVAPDRLLAVIRVKPEGEMLQSFSDDAGLTWCAPTSTGVWGFPCHLLKLADGRLLMSYGYRRDKMGVRAIFSGDGGRTWDTDDIHILRDDAVGRGADCGYPISVELGNGELFTVYYITCADGITHVAGTRWRA